MMMKEDMKMLMKMMKVKNPKRTLKKRRRKGKKLIKIKMKKLLMLKNAQSTVKIKSLQPPAEPQVSTFPIGSRQASSQQ